MNSKKKFVKKIMADFAVGIVVAAVSSAIPAAEACTTTIVTKGASADGSAYVTHSNDSFSSDPSIVYVPAKDYPAGSMRKVYPSAIAWDDYPDYNCTSNPRLVAPERAPGYSFPGLKHTKPLGEIPQVSHTYAYFDSDYGIMNEKGLMLGECTNNSLHLEYLEPKEGRGIFYAFRQGRFLDRPAGAGRGILCGCQPVPDPRHQKGQS